jgi:endonuclease IV
MKQLAINAIVSAIIFTITSRCVGSLIEKASQPSVLPVAQMLVYVDYSHVNYNCIDLKAKDLCERIVSYASKDFSFEFNSGTIFSGTPANAEIVKDRILYMGKGFLNIKDGFR